MILYKNIFLALFGTIAIQLILGINSASAVPCEEALRATWDKTNFYTSDQDDHRGTYRKGDRVKEIYISAYTPYYSASTYEMALEKFPQMVIGFAEADGGKDCKAAAESISSSDNTMRQCIGKYLIANNCDVSAFKNAGSGQKRNNSVSSSSNQSVSAATSNSQASQNKQNYQTAQLAHNQANAGRGKKRNAQAEVPDCIKPNANQTNFKNSCNHSVNISYCFSGENNTGASSAAKQLLSDLNCNNQQFANTELSAGEELAGDYVGLNIAAMVCKSPSQPLDMNFDGREALGRCSF